MTIVITGGTVLTQDGPIEADVAVDGDVFIGFGNTLELSNTVSGTHSGTFNLGGGTLSLLSGTHTFLAGSGATGFGLNIVTPPCAAGLAAVHGRV